MSEILETLDQSLLALPISRLFFPNTITDEIVQSKEFITFQSIYEWTRVPMGLLPSAYHFQKIVAEYVLVGIIYIICELCIDDISIYRRT